MQFIYTSSHGGREIHSVYKVSYLYRMDYICKNKNLKTTGQREPHPPPPMTPACGNARRVAPGHAGGSDAWKEKPPAMEISTEPPTLRHMIGHGVGRMGVETHTACCSREGSGGLLAPVQLGGGSAPSGFLLDRAHLLPRLGRGALP